MLSYVNLAQCCRCEGVQILEGLTKNGATECRVLVCKKEAELVQGSKRFEASTKQRISNKLKIQPNMTSVELFLYHLCARQQQID